jgi:Asp-tRNA(Asn)/Glu-tRNA(Gln) amidotransferase C subunit
VRLALPGRQEQQAERVRLELPDCREQQVSRELKEILVLLDAMEELVRLAKLVLREDKG